MIYDLDLGIKPVTQNVAQVLLHHVTDAATKFEVATCRSNGLEGDTFTRNVTDAQTNGCRDTRTHGRRTGFGTKLINPFFKEKSGCNNIKTNTPSDSIPCDCNLECFLALQKMIYTLLFLLLSVDHD